MRVGNYRPREKDSARLRELSRKRNLTEAEKAEQTEENRKAYPPAAEMARVPACVIQTWSRPRSRTFREDD